MESKKLNVKHMLCNAYYGFLFFALSTIGFALIFKGLVLKENPTIFAIGFALLAVGLMHLPIYMNSFNKHNNDGE